LLSFLFFKALGYSKFMSVALKGKKSVRREVDEPARADVAAPAPAAAPAVPESKKAALQQALQQALNRSSKKGGADKEEELDVYGMGSATDRLQFGYSPASHDEAVRFHGLYTTTAWLAARKRNGVQVFVRHEKLKPQNCEPIVTMLKLKRYWSRMQNFNDDLKEGATGMSVDAADAFLAALDEQANKDDDAQSEQPSTATQQPKRNRAKEDATGKGERDAKMRRMELL
jgi:hypothetical protein